MNHKIGEIVAVKTGPGGYMLITDIDFDAKEYKGLYFFEGSCLIDTDGTIIDPIDEVLEMSYLRETEISESVPPLSDHEFLSRVRAAQKGVCLNEV